MIGGGPRAVHAQVGRSNRACMVGAATALLAAGCIQQTVLLHDMEDASTADSAAPKDTADAMLPPGDAGQGGEAGCLYHALTPKMQNADLVVVLDRSAAMQQPFAGSLRVTAAQTALIKAVSTNDSRIRFGFEQFPGAQCQTGTCCAGQVSVTTLNNADAMVNSINQCSDSHGSGCSGNDAPWHLAMSNIKFTGNNDRYVVLVTASEPSCSGQDPGPICDNASGAISDLINDGVFVNIVSVGYQPDRAFSCLTQVTAATLYTPMSTKDLSNALTAIMGKAARASCTVSVYDLPPNQTSLDVSLDNYSYQWGGVPQDSNDGWSFNNAHTGIVLKGRSCELLLSSTSPKPLYVGYWTGNCGPPWQP